MPRKAPTRPDGDRARGCGSAPQPLAERVIEELKGALTQEVGRIVARELRSHREDADAPGAPACRDDGTEAAADLARILRETETLLDRHAPEESGAAPDAAEPADSFGDAQLELVACGATTRTEGPDLILALADEVDAGGEEDPFPDEIRLPTALEGEDGTGDEGADEAFGAGADPSGDADESDRRPVDVAEAVTDLAPAEDRPPLAGASDHAARSTWQDFDLPRELRELRERVEQIAAALARGSPDAAKGR